MTIQFSEQELAIIRRYFDKVGFGETQKQLHELDLDFPEWNTVFLLVRKLLAYGVNCTTQTGQEISYEELQKRTQKSRDMLVTIHAYFSEFDNLLALYVAQP